MLPFLISGLVLGAAYAITAAGVTMTLVSAGILNFAFGSMAFAVARFYYYLHVQLAWGSLPSALLAILVLAPAMGFVFWAVLFRYLRSVPPLIRVVATIGLSVALPAIVEIIFGNEPLQSAPGLAAEPVRVFSFLGASITLDQVYVFIFLVLVGLAGVALIRFTDVGLRVRAMVDSEAMTNLAGTNPATISAGVWAASALLAGLVGVLLAPIIGLDVTAYTLLMAGSFAALIGARLKNVGAAVIIGLLLGVANGIVNRYVPANSSFKPDITASVPFVFIVIALLFNLRGRDFSSLGETSGALDVAIRPVGDKQPRSAADSQVSTSKEITTGLRGITRLVSVNSAPLGTMLVIAILPLVLTGLWLGQVGIGLAFAIAFLSFTLVTGEGGMIWLCEITFAGFGAVFTAYLASHGWSVIPAMLVAALITVPIGIIVGLLTVRLGSLYVALVTLTFGFLIDSLVFSLNVFDNFGSGLSLARPSFALSDEAFAYLTFGIFCVLALIIFNLRNSTAGLALNAARSSETATRMLGFNVAAMRILLSGAAAFVAAIGGALLASAAGSAIPASYATLGGLVWLAVLVTIGVRSTVAAAVAGLSYALLPVVFQNYLPVAYASVPAALFGIGAVLVVRNPDGVGATHGRQLRVLLATIKRHAGDDGHNSRALDSAGASSIRGSNGSGVLHARGSTSSSNEESLKRSGQASKP